MGRSCETAHYIYQKDAIGDCDKKILREMVGDEKIEPASMISLL